MAPRRKRNLLDVVLADSASTIVVLDGDRRMRFFSPGMETKTGWTADQVEGLICEPSLPESPTPFDHLTSALAPSIDVLNGRPQSVATVLPTASGGLANIGLTFVPVMDADDSVIRIIVACTNDIKTSRAEASLSQKLHAEVTSLRLEFRRRFSAPSFIGNCPAIGKALDQAELLKGATHGYCIVGPNGSGRRHLAKVIHTSGRQHESSFVSLDCRLLTPEQLFDSLRHLKHLSADRSLPNHQHTGTLVLGDVDRCPREVQRWILDDGDEFHDVRLVGVCEDSLDRQENADWLLPEFADLFSTLEIKLPPLHERGDDINLLSQHFMQMCRRTQETSAEALTSEVVKELQFYRWPGNVRELQQVISEACQNSFDVELGIDDLPFSFRAGMEAQQLPALPTETDASLEQILERFETDVLLKTLSACRGNKADAARRLGMTRPRLYRRLKTLGIEIEE